MPEGPEGSENKIMPNDCLANYCKRTENTKGLKKLLELATAVEACDRITAVAQYLHSLWACNQYMAHYHASALTSDLTLTWGRGGKSMKKQERCLFGWGKFVWHWVCANACLWDLNTLMFFSLAPIPRRQILHLHKEFWSRSAISKSFYIELWSLHLKKKLLSWQQRSENNKASYRPKHLAKLNINEDKND